MKKLFLLLVAVSIVLAACTPAPNIPVKTVDQECKEAGYVPGQDVNKLINLTNKLADIVNLCAKANNITEQVPYVTYIPSAPSK
jgi:hypothetical protein